MKKLFVLIVVLARVWGNANLIEGSVKVPYKLIFEILADKHFPVYGDIKMSIYMAIDEDKSAISIYVGDNYLVALVNSDIEIYTTHLISFHRKLKTYFPELGFNEYYVRVVSYENLDNVYHTINVTKELKKAGL